MSQVALPRPATASPVKPARRPRSKSDGRAAHRLNTVLAEPAVLTSLTHPLARRHYRVATSAIEELVDLVERCVRLLTPGALIHARPRMGGTHAIDYMVLHLARERPNILVLRMSCEYHRTDFEGAFFSTLLVAAGERNQQSMSIAQKRFALLRKLVEQLQLRSGHIVVLLCDEGQRLSRHALQWRAMDLPPGPCHQNRRCRAVGSHRRRLQP